MESLDSLIGTMESVVSVATKIPIAHRFPSWLIGGASAKFIERKPTMVVAALSNMGTLLRDSARRAASEPLSPSRVDDLNANSRCIDDAIDRVNSTTGTMDVAVFSTWPVHPAIPRVTRTDASPISSATIANRKLPSTRTRKTAKINRAIGTRRARSDADASAKACIIGIPPVRCTRMFGN